MGSEGRLLRRRCLINLRVKEASKQGRTGGRERRKADIDFSKGSEQAEFVARRCFRQSVFFIPHWHSDSLEVALLRLYNWKSRFALRRKRQSLFCSRKWDGDGLQRFNPLSRSQLLQYRQPLRDRERASEREGEAAGGRMFTRCAASEVLPNHTGEAEGGRGRQCRHPPTHEDLSSLRGQCPLLRARPAMKTSRAGAEEKEEEEEVG